MDNLLFLIAIALIGWVAYRSHKQEPIIPFLSRKKSDENTKKNSNNNKQLIKSLLEIEDIKYNMIHLSNHTYVMALKCQPVNYRLRNSLEQEGIYVRFEQWLTTIEYETIIHLQNRQVDYKPQQDEFLMNIEQDDLLNENARNYCMMTIEYMNQWLYSQPRFETHRYVLFPYRVPVTKNMSEEDIILKASRELVRRATTAQNFLEACGVRSEICTTADLAEMLYFSLNRKRSTKARFKDIELREMLALYCTNEQDEIRIRKVLENVQPAEQKETETA